MFSSIVVIVTTMYTGPYKCSVCIFLPSNAGSSEDYSDQ